MSEGQRLVAVRVAELGAAEVARRAKTSESMARHLAVGRKTPSPAMKDRLATALDVPLEAWDRPARKAKKKAAKAKKRKRARSSAALTELWATVDRLDDAISVVDLGSLLGASLLGKRTTALDKIARLQGEGELSFAALTKSRVWNDLLAKLRPILERHPECASEIAALLEALEA